MAQSLMFELMKNELESYEKKINTFSKIISNDIKSIDEKGNSKVNLSKEESDTLLNIVYRIMGDAEGNFAQKLLELWGKI